MGAPYSQDLRERVLGAVDGGLGVYAAAPLFRVSVSYIYKVLARRRATGETRAKPFAGGAKPKLADHDEVLRAQVEAVADATLEELQAWLAAHHGVRVSIGCLWGHLRRLGLTLKKSRSARPNRIGPMSPRRARHGAPARAASCRNAWCSSTKRARPLR